MAVVYIEGLPERDYVIMLMDSSSSEKEWNENADKVKKLYGGVYPNFWFSAIVLSGLADNVFNRFKKK